jgi:hypothetical protein
MKINSIQDYIYTTKLNLDLSLLRVASKEMNDLIKEKFIKIGDIGIYQEHAAETAKVYDQYNLLMYSHDQFFELYEGIRKMFRTIYKGNDPHYIQCWLNYYNKGDYIDWHGHAKYKWHGFFCVDCEPSKTTYRLPRDENGKLNVVDIPSEDNLLVMSRSNGDRHRSWPWEQEDRPRITIAYDILPKQYAQKDWVNHWIPI